MGTFKIFTFLFRYGFRGHIRFCSDVVEDMVVYDDESSVFCQFRINNLPTNSPKKDDYCRAVDASPALTLIHNDG